MKLQRSVLMLAVLLAAHVSSAASPYLDQAEPGTDVKRFAPAVISVPGRFQQSMTVSSDRNEYYYGITDAKNWNYESILCTRVLPDGRTVTETPSFVTHFRFKANPVIGEPFLSPDGRQLFFVADYPPDIWVVRRKHGAEWSDAEKLPDPINSPAAEWSPCVVPSGTLYFCSGRGRSDDENRLYRCEWKNGAYAPPELLKGPINDDAVGDPAVSADETVMVFSSPKKGGYGGIDLYISLRLPDGSWSKGVNLGPKVNTAAEELGPRISPDGKFLFFYRREKWQDATYSDIYWTELKQFVALAEADRVRTGATTPLLPAPPQASER